MITINIVHDEDTVSLQFFDYYYAYKQNQYPHSNYKPNIAIKFNQRIDPKYINIALVSFRHCGKFFHQSEFDLILIENSGESLEVASVTVEMMLRTIPMVYFLCSTNLAKDHVLYDKIIEFNHCTQNFLDYIARPFYPQYWGIKDPLVKSKDICYIHGLNRTNREYFLRCLHQIVGTKLKIKNSIFTPGAVKKLIDCAFESQQDTEFRSWANENIVNCDYENQDNIEYYSSCPLVGIDKKFGQVAPGNFILDEYFQHQCVVYPESSWINNQMFLTEKTYKCLVTKTVPWPISGANFHALMNTFGFQTAMNLLPKELQIFDTIMDHRERYKHTCNAILWAAEHPEIWNSSEANAIKNNNFERMWNNKLSLVGIEKFDQLIKSRYS